MKRRQAYYLFGAGAVVIVGLGVALGVMVAHWAGSATTNTSTAATDRHAAYAALYLAAWRQDEGRGNSTVAATLLSTRLRTLLLMDTLRTTTDDAVATHVRPLTGQDVPIVVTLDAVVGTPAATISDATMQASLSLRAETQHFSLMSLVPISDPTSVANTNTSTGPATTRRMWLAVFRADASPDWMTVKNVQLVVTNLDGQAQRILTWPDPALLTDQ